MPSKRTCRGPLSLQVYCKVFFSLSSNESLVSNVSKRVALCMSNIANTLTSSIICTRVINILLSSNASNLIISLLFQVHQQGKNQQICVKHFSLPRDRYATTRIQCTYTGTVTWTPDRLTMPGAPKEQCRVIHSIQETINISGRYETL